MAFEDDVRGLPARRDPSPIDYRPLATGSFINHLDLFVEHFAGETVDRHMHPKMLLPFHKETIRIKLLIGLMIGHGRLGNPAGDQIVTHATTLGNSRAHSTNA
jgi:hypothetical protein